eukprot:4653766-Prymnesium_polylepis.1
MRQRQTACRSWSFGRSGSSAAIAHWRVAIDAGSGLAAALSSSRAHDLPRPGRGGLEDATRRTTWGVASRVPHSYGT